MKILYISCYPDTVFKTMIEQGLKKSQPAQKMNKLIAKGFCLNGYDVDVLLIENGAYYKKPPGTAIEEYNGKKITYYVKTPVDIKGIRRLTGNIITRTFVRDWCKKNRDGILFADILRPYVHTAVKEARRNKNKVVALVTDLLEYLYPESGNMFYRVMRKIKIRSFIGLQKYIGCFIFLTEYMNEKFQIEKERFIVLEGLVDLDCAAEPDGTDEFDKNAYLYTGAVSKQFGLKTLAETFCSEELSHEKLLLYGTGDYVEEVRELAREHGNISYCGCVPNEIAVQKQKGARCLINPRPTGENYTMYSFPSKNIEYMLSGRPVITTRLPGIPDEYDDYVYYFDDDTRQGMEATLKNIVSTDDCLLSERGRLARRFVLDNKNNKVQVKRILDMVLETNLRSRV